MSRPDKTWIDDWEIGKQPAREQAVSMELVQCFSEFWDAKGLDDKAKSTKNRYSGALHALGGYLVEEAVEKEGLRMTTRDLLAEHIDAEGGPLIHLHEQSWQEEIDMVCRKLHKYLKAQGSIA